MLSTDQKEAVRDHLRKVLASHEFVRSDRAAALLQHVVTRTLEGDAEPLRERSIGIAVFERPEDWDPKNDTTVRTEARRVRKKLTEYYASPAAEGHTVCIDVPVGGYVPTFEFNTPPETNETSAAQPATKPPSNSFKLIAGAAVCVLFAFALVAYRSHTASPSHFESVAFTSEYGHTFAPSISPDGSQIAYVWDSGKADYRIYIKQVHGGSGRRLTGSNSSELDPSWSPNGRQIAFLRVQDAGTDVAVRDVAEGSERTVGVIATQKGDWTGDPGPLIGNLGPSWTPDGQSLIVSDSTPHAASGLFRISLADGSRQQLTNPEGSAKDFLPRISPNGRYLAFVRAISHGIADIYRQDLKNGSLKRLTNEAHSINGLAWSGQAEEIVFSSDREGAYQAWTLQLSDGAIEKLDTESATAIDPQIATNAGWMAYVTTTQNWNIDRIDLDGNHAAPPARLIASSGRNHTARYSPDGKHIAFVSDRSGTWEVWLCNVDCSEPQKLTEFHGPWIGGLNWSPDSQQLAFDARPGRNSAIYRLSITHPVPELIEKNQFEERMPSWSFDGRSLYFNSDRDGSVAIWKRDLASSAVSRITDGFNAQGIDATGDMLAGHSDGTIWRVNGTTLKAEQPGPEAVADPALAWSYRNGKLYLCKTGKDGMIDVIEYGAHGAHSIATLSINFPPTSASVDIAPDGRSILVTAVDHSSSNIYRRIPVTASATAQNHR